VADGGLAHPSTAASSPLFSAPADELKSNDMIFPLTASASAFRRVIRDAERAPQVGSYSRNTGEPL